MEGTALSQDVLALRAFALKTEPLQQPNRPVISGNRARVDAIEVHAFKAKLHDCSQGF